MSCLPCKKQILHDSNKKIRKLANTLAHREGKNQVLIEYQGKQFIECEACWIQAGKKGTPLEYFIV